MDRKIIAMPMLVPSNILLCSAIILVAVFTPTYALDLHLVTEPLAAVAGMFAPEEPAYTPSVTQTAPDISTSPLSPPIRLLMGPGPSTPHPRVLAAASLPIVGHMHPEFLQVMDDVKAWLRYSFRIRSH